jgi:hypothetical protein
LLALVGYINIVLTCYVILQVDSYRERILAPREEARKQKQEQELNLIMGHTFRGRGNQLDDVRAVFRKK